MAMIAPTVDSVGDAALTNSIIDKSITELQDNIMTTLGSFALTKCAALKKVVFGAVTKVEASAFAECSALEVADFHQPITLLNNALHGCVSLKTLILRGDSVSTVTLSNAGTPINSGKGYIYVPAALVDTYKASSKWSTYANQIRAIEDWPEVCDPYSWEAVAAAISANTYKDIYKIGDMIPVDLGSEGVINMQIAAFDTDQLADGSGTAAISWVAKELLATSKRMNPNRTSTTPVEGKGAIGGWEKCELRAYLQSTIKALIPTDVGKIIQGVTKTQESYDTTGTKVSQTTEDELWLPGYNEVRSGVYATLFPNDSSRIKSCFGASSASAWWLREAYSASEFRYVKTTGAATSYSSCGAQNGVCLGFCTGKTPT